ncbi:hypothetical protein [Actinomycetospora soli]|nr:hypothetical protein [Actinomycetospora soli]
MVVEGAGHYEMYDEPAYVDAAVARLATFYAEYLGSDVQASATMR